MTAFNAGDQVELMNGGYATILEDSKRAGEPKVLGSGGQGEVYLVEHKGKKYALKWYTSKEIIASEKFRKNIINNVDLRNKRPKDIPSNFIWPLFVTNRKKDRNGNNSYGYIMELFPDGYYSLDTYLVGYKVEAVANGNRRVPVRFVNNEVKMIAALNIINGIRGVQGLGLSYQDLNGGGIRMNMDTGDVLICDTDNIGAEPSGVKGYPGYMAPEVVLDKAAPNQMTDMYSLAITLYRLLIVADPFKGKKMYEYKGPVSNTKEREWYGTNPVFCWDPNDDSNRPVIGIDTNSLTLWKKYPEYIRDLFTTVFTDGRRNPNKRVIPYTWAMAIKRAITECFVCPRCKGTTFIDSDNAKDGVIKCCGVSHPIFELHKGKDITYLAATPGKRIRRYETHTGDDAEPKEIAGEFVESPRHPGVVGIRNTSGKDWTIDGEATVATRRVADVKKIVFRTDTVAGSRVEIYAKKL